MKYFWLSLGFVALGLGILGIPLPILPTTPFFLLAVYSFSKSSDRFHQWFIKTKMYRDYVDSYKRNRPLTIAKKAEIVGSITLVLVASFYFVDNLYLRIMLSSIFVGHIIYFFGFIKTKTRDGVKQPFFSRILKRTQ